MRYQTQKVLDYLQSHQHGASTIELRRELDIMHPSGRVDELRQAGYNILTHWTNENQPTARGNHRVARYVLLN